MGEKEKLDNAYRDIYGENPPSHLGLVVSALKAIFCPANLLIKDGRNLNYLNQRSGRKISFVIKSERINKK